MFINDALPKSPTHGVTIPAVENGFLNFILGMICTLKRNYFLNSCFENMCHSIKIGVVSRKALFNGSNGHKLIIDREVISIYEAG